MKLLRTFAVLFMLSFTASVGLVWTVMPAMAQDDDGDSGGDSEGGEVAPEVPTAPVTCPPSGCNSNTLSVGPTNGLLNSVDTFRTTR